jgi:hypothetical protein
MSRMDAGTILEHPKCEKCEIAGSDGKMPESVKLRQERELGEGCSNIMT